MGNITKNLLKKIIILPFLFLGLVGKSQNRDNINNRDILYLTSGGKLNPL